jgi:hypothetical protein
MYDSAGEAAYARHLDLLKRTGKILRWDRGQSQIVFHGGALERLIRFKPDFIVTELDGSSHADDFKGLVRLKPKIGKSGKLGLGKLELPEAFRLRVILWEAKFPNLPVRVVDQYGNVKWTLDEKRRGVAA